MTESGFLTLIHTNPVNTALLERLPALGLHQCYLTAGCLFQTVWNHRSGKAPDADIRDYDVFYFDTDLSWEAEDAVIRRVDGCTRDLGVKVEVRNQARVHLWYAERFGRPRAPLTSSRDGIRGFLVECTCVGVGVRSGELYAPFGLDDLWNGILRPNPVNPEPELFRAKAESYRSRWLWLRVADGCNAIRGIGSRT
jgi:uncharacterized protein